MDVSGYQHSDSITIACPPADVYAIISDVTRIGELSPVCASASWDDPAQAGTTGAWFTGHNAIGDITWDTHCQVIAAEADREFSFINHGQTGDVELVRWGFVLEPVGDTTMVTESWQVLPAYPDFVLGGDPTADVAQRIDGMAQLARDGIAETLVNLKRIAES
jgi:Polyketide cyclase / dehydrase and lipid transport